LESCESFRGLERLLAVDLRRGYQYRDGAVSGDTENNGAVPSTGPGGIRDNGRILRVVGLGDEHDEEMITGLPAGST